MVRGLKRENLRYKAEADESLGTQRQERVMEQLKEKDLRYKAKSDESRRRAMSMMVGGQASLVVREAFTG